MQHVHVASPARVVHGVEVVDGVAAVGAVAGDEVGGDQALLAAAPGRHAGKEGTVGR